MTAVNNEPWEVSEQGFPHAEAIESQLRFLLRYAILAPSPQNSQPWSFAVRDNKIFVLADLGRSQPVADPDRRELYIALGCALENLLVAAEHFGFDHAVSYFPQQWRPELAATVLFEPGGSVTPARSGTTLAAIRQRRNNTGLFQGTAVSPELRRRLVACCIEPDLVVNLSDDYLLHQWIAALTVQSDRADLSNPAFRMELDYWTRQGVFEPDLVAPGSRAPDQVLARKTTAILLDQLKVESCALLGVIRGAGDSHLIHLRSGQLFERIWLTATTLGISINPMSQTMRRSELRSAVADLFPSIGWIPQHLFRVGYSLDEPGPRTPRRTLSDVIL